MLDDEERSRIQHGEGAMTELETELVEIVADALRDVADLPQPQQMARLSVLMADVRIAVARSVRRAKVEALQGFMEEFALNEETEFRRANQQ